MEFVGRVVAECGVEEHVLGDERTPLRLRLTFTDGPGVTIDGHPSGEAIRLHDEPLTSGDMQEHGRLEVRTSGFPCDVLAPGATVREVEPLVDARDGIVFGLRIATDADVVHVYNWGDDLFIVRDLPEHVRNEACD